MKETGLIFFGTTFVYLAILVGWNVYTYSFRGPETTISCTLTWLSHQWPIIPVLLFGFLALLAGHWVWPAVPMSELEKPAKPKIYVEDER